MSLSTTGSQQHPTTKSGSKTDGRSRSGTPPHNHSGSHVPETPGFRWGLAELVSSEVRRVKGYRQVQVRCTSCQTEKWVSFDQIVERWNRPSDKPKGVYGTCSTADPAIVSLLTDA